MVNYNRDRCEVLWEQTRRKPLLCQTLYFINSFLPYHICWCTLRGNSCTALPTIWGLLLPLLLPCWRTTLAICFLIYKMDIISCSFGCSEKYESSLSTNWHHLNICRALKSFPGFHNLWALSQLWLQWTTICFCDRMPCKQQHNSGSTEDRNGRRDPGLNEERK